MYDPHKKELTKPHCLTYEAWANILPIVEAISKLQPGQKSAWNLQFSEHTNRVRDWLYKYLKEVNLKPLYKILKDTPTTLIIRRQAFVTPTPIGQAIFNPIEVFVRDKLLQALDEDEAFKIAQAAYTSGEITDVALLAIMDEWRRVMGIIEPKAKRPILDTLSDISWLEQLNGPKTKDET